MSYGCHSYLTLENCIIMPSPEDAPEGAPKTRALVTPETLKGFQDLLAEDTLVRYEVINKIRAVFERYGFVPFETPMLESLETLLGSGGEESNKSMFRLESPEGVPIALRYDLTVPFARLLAQYPDRLKPPVRRYTFGPAFRADKPDPGRYRQFVQFDIDAAGSESVAVDAEIIAAMCEAFTVLGIREFRVLINNRKLLDALLDGCGITDTAVHKHILRVIDKLQKIGIENVRRELGPGRKDEESGAPIHGAGLEPDVIRQIEAFIEIKGMDRKAVVEAIRQVLPDSELTNRALGEMIELASALECLGVAEERAVFDPSLARGLDYYTGPVYEIVLTQAPQFGSVAGGGRYDQLVERFLENPIPAAGMSFGLDRLMAALTHLGAVKPVATVTKVLIINFPGMPAEEYLRIAAELRGEGIPTEVYFGGKKGFKQQLSYANAKGIPLAVILGEDELKAGNVSVKDLREGKELREGIKDHEQYRQAGKSGQVTIPRGELAEYVKKLEV